MKAMARPTLRHRIALRPGGGTRGRHPRRRARRHPVRGAGTALVVLTGRAGLVALICVLPVGVLALARSDIRGAAGPARWWRSRSTSALAASTRRLRFSRLGRRRRPARRARRRGAGRREPGRAATSAAWSATRGRRRPAPNRARTRSNIAARTTTPGRHDAAAGAPRRPAVGAGDRALASARSGWRAGRARTGCRGRCGSCRRSCRASTCRRGWRSCANSTARSRC